LRKLTIVYHHGGGGHRASAEALKNQLTSQNSPWDVTLLNFQELLAPMDVLRRLTGLRIEDAYNLILRKGWTRFSPQLLKVLQATVQLYHAQIVKLLRQYWAKNPADLVLSVIPHFNRELAESLPGGETEIPFVTLLTDLADYPPRFWIEPESQYLIVGTEKARQQAVDIGHSPDRIFLISGMVLKPKFYEKPKVDRAAERARRGLEPGCPTGIVLFGGHGSKVMLDIARRIDQSGADVQLIMICGHNQKLAAELERMKTRKPMLVEGFTKSVESYMALADFFIGKPGPGSISEALQFHLPVIVECNAKTLPQERYNAKWVTEKGYGIVLSSFDEIAAGVKQLLDRETFSEISCDVCKYSNRALFEVPEILEACWTRGKSHPTEEHAPIDSPAAYISR
jgi:1,2-diacylglycerol 3-beta-galactosyltransferase